MAQSSREYSNGNEQPNDFITIIHFNDCYNVEPGPKSSGAAGFLTAINQYRHLNPIILFSGDIISPSFMSTFTKGEQMIPVLNDIGVDCAVFGNHEFDYGVDNLIEFKQRTTFPWLLSNVIDKETSNQLGDGLVYQTMERGGLKFGLIGLIEEEWLSTLSTLDSSDVIYQDFVTRGQELARWLKGAPNYVDYVIALTHFRTPNDIRLADSVPDIDLILGGHDHDYDIIHRPNCYIIKSGTDFREFSVIKLKLNAQYLSEKGGLLDGARPLETESETSKQFDFDEQSSTDLCSRSPRSTLRPFVDIKIERVDCIAYPPEENLKNKLDKFVSTIDEKMSKVLGQFNCELDGRFSSIRKGETNLGNFVTDIMLASTHADLAILNSGTLRSDRIHPKGDFTMRDLFNILGYIDPIAVLQASGYHIWKALENGVSQWPKLEGRFPQISGGSFVFDPSKPPFKRIDPKDVIIGDEPLDLNKSYKLTTKAYLASGKDGYDVLKGCEILVPGDESPDLTTSILNHFEAINIIKSNRRTHHRQSIICLSRLSIKKILDQTANNRSQFEQNSFINDDNNNSNCHIAKEVEVEQSQAAATTKSDERQGDENKVNNCDHHYQHHGRNIDYGDDCDDNENSDAITENKHTNCSAVVQGPMASSPLVGLCAPTPILSNMQLGMANSDMLENLSEEIGNKCGGATGKTPPSTIQKPPRQTRTKRMMSLYEMEHEQCKLEPKIEGRIKILGVTH